MAEEIKYINNDEKPKLNEISGIQEIKPLDTIKKEEINLPAKKVSLPTWNIEPPVEIQRNVK